PTRRSSDLDDLDEVVAGSVRDRRRLFHARDVRGRADELPDRAARVALVDKEIEVASGVRREVACRDLDAPASGVPERGIDVHPEKRDVAVIGRGLAAGATG